MPIGHPCSSVKKRIPQPYRTNVKFGSGYGNFPPGYPNFLCISFIIRDRDSLLRLIGFPVRSDRLTRLMGFPVRSDRLTRLIGFPVRSDRLNSSDWFSRKKRSLNSPTFSSTRHAFLLILKWVTNSQPYNEVHSVL